MPCVYILECRDRSYYTGFCTDLERRLAEHQAGTYDGYTTARCPVKLVFSQEAPTLQDAFRLERQLKGWSRAKKETVIAGRYDLLPGLSQSRQSGWEGPVA